MLAASVPRPAPTPPSVTALCRASSKRVTKVSTPSPCRRWKPSSSFTTLSLDSSSSGANLR
eukprot:4643690-Amphidinium_carterae.1